METGLSKTDSGGEQLSSLTSATKNYNCWECNYKTTCKSTLKDHMSVHKGTHQIKCETTTQEQESRQKDRKDEKEEDICIACGWKGKCLQSHLNHRLNKKNCKSSYDLDHLKEQSHQKHNTSMKQNYMDQQRERRDSMDSRSIQHIHQDQEYSYTNFNTLSLGNLDKMNKIILENNKKQKAYSKKKVANNCLPNFTSTTALNLLNKFTCQHCPYSTKWNKELNRHVRNKHINEHDANISSQTLPDQIVTNHDISTIPALVQSAWKSQKRRSKKVDIFLCQHCNYRSMSKNNMVSHNEAIHGVTMDDGSLEEKGMEDPVAKAETVFVPEAPRQREQSELVPPLPQHQSENKEVHVCARVDPLRPPKAPEKPLSAYMRFSKKCWESVRTEHPGMKLWEIGSIIGGKWRDLKAEEKKEYQDAWNLDKVRNSPAFYLVIHGYPRILF